MKKNAGLGKYIWPLVLVIGCLAVAASGVYFIQGETKDYIGLGVAVVIVMCSFAALIGSIGPLVRSAKSFNSACKQIENSAMLAKSKEELFDMLGTELFEKNGTLSSNWLAYKRSVMKNDAKSGLMLEDIQDYFNTDMLRSDIAKNQVFDLLPSFFTGLGILGTFVGLMLGLKDFSVDNANAMMDTIPILIEGIKVAFITSIYGISMSLLYSIASKNVFKSTEVAMYGFVDCYHDNVYDYSDYRDALVQLVGLGAQQAKSFADFSDNFSAQLSRSLNAVFAPTVKDMQDSLDSFVEVAAKAQVEGLERIVDKFVLNMDRAMGNRFEQFSRIMDDLSARQRENSASINDAMAQLVSTTGKVAHLNEEFEKTLEAFRSMQLSTGEMMLNTRQSVESVFAVNAEIQRNVQSMNQFINSQQEYFTGIMQSQQETYEQCRRLVDSSMTMEQSVGTVARQLESQGQKLIVAAESHIEAVKQGMGDQTETVKAMYDTLISTADTNFGSMQASMREQAKLITAAYTSLQGVTQTMNQELSQMSGIMQAYYSGLEKNIEKSFTETFRKFDEQLSDITAHLSDTIGEIRDVTDEIPDILNESFHVFESELKHTAEYVAAQRR